MLLHSKEIEKHHLEFLDDLRLSLESFLRGATTDPDQRNIFKTCTAAHAVLSAAAKRGGPLLAGAAGAVRRCAVLAPIRQVSLCRVELRRLIECVLWHVYFVDHPVESQEFLEHPDRGWGEDRTATPIAAAAAAEMGFFFRYAKERFKEDGTGLILTAVNDLHATYGNLSADVHAGVGAVHATGTLALAFDRYDTRVSASLSREVRAVAADSVLICFAIIPEYLALCDVVEKAWLEWLVGPTRAPKTRLPDFGIKR